MTNDTSPKNLGGRPPWNPDDTTRERIRAQALMGMRAREIATLEKVSENTLRKHCVEELAVGKAQGQQVAFSVIGQMMRGYRTVRSGGQREVDEKSQLQAALKHLNLVHHIYEGKADDGADAAPLPWSDDRAATAESVTRSEDS